MKGCVVRKCLQARERELPVATGRHVCRNVVHGPHARVRTSLDAI